MIKPKTRKEKLLSAIANDTPVPIQPKNREELFLAHIAEKVNTVNAPVAETLSESAHVLVEDGGEVKRVSKDMIGGGGSVEIPKPLTYDYMPEGYAKPAMAEYNSQYENTKNVELDTTKTLSNGYLYYRTSLYFQYMGSCVEKLSTDEDIVFTVTVDGVEHTITHDMEDAYSYTWNDEFWIGNPSFYNGLHGDGNTYKDNGCPFLFVCCYDDDAEQSYTNFILPSTAENNGTHIVSYRCMYPSFARMSYDLLPDEIGRYDKANAGALIPTNETTEDEWQFGIATFLNYEDKNGDRYCGLALMYIDENEDMVFCDIKPSEYTDRLRLKSPNGTWFRIEVSDDGTLTATADN